MSLTKMFLIFLPLVFHTISCKARRRQESSQTLAAPNNSRVTVIFIQTGDDVNALNERETDILEAKIAIERLRTTTQLIEVPRNIYGPDLTNYVEENLDKIEETKRKLIHIVVSGHGLKLRMLNGSFKSVLNDQDGGGFNALGLVNATIAGIVQSNNYKMPENLFVLLSACFSGNLVSEVSKKLANNQNFGLIASSASNQVSGYGQSDKDDVVIENVLGAYLDLFNSRSQRFLDADADHNEVVTIGELQTYLERLELGSLASEFMPISWSDTEKRWLSPSNFFVFPTNTTPEQIKAAIYETPNQKFVQRMKAFRQDPLQTGSRTVPLLSNADRLGQWAEIQPTTVAYSAKEIIEYNKKTGMQENPAPWPHYELPDAHFIMGTNGKMYRANQLRNTGYIQ